MGTDKRARQKEFHRSRLEAARKEAAAAKRRQRVIRVGAIVGAMVILLGVMAIFGGRDDTSKDTATKTTTSTTPASTTPSAAATLKGPGPGATIKGDTPCPKADGSSARTTSFENPPPTCIDASKTYKATFQTTKGTFTVTLDAKAAPVTVNNFVVLARYHFYDGIPFHRIVPDFVIQAGDPSDTPDGQGGPGYTIKEEPPANKTYEKYDLAMAKTSAPNSTGSQFFVVTGDPSALNSAGTYSLFGKVTEGTEVVDAIAATPVTGDQPNEQVTIERLTITES